MAGPNPLLQLGSISRLRGSLLIPSLPQLNITAPFLGRAGIRLAVEGDITQMLAQMVGMVQSQEVYLPASITAAIVKTTPLANLYKRQWESDANLGDVTFTSDASQLDVFDFSNCSIEGFGGIDASGGEATYTLSIKGTYYVNSNLFNGT
jgi:hypothetical protein